MRKIVSIVVMTVSILGLASIGLSLAANMPILIGKSRAQVVKAIGEPDDTFNWLGGGLMSFLTWKYENCPRPHYHTEVMFEGKATQVDRVSTYYQSDKGGMFGRVYPSQVVPVVLMGRKPARVVIDHDRNIIQAVWKISNGFYLVSVTIPVGKVYRERKKLNLKTGNLERSYEQVGPWQSCPVESITQLGKGAGRKMWGMK